MTDYRVAAGEAQEDQVTAAIETVTSRVPSSLFLAAALASILASVSFKIAKKGEEALFVGQWVAPFLLKLAFETSSDFIRSASSQRPRSSSLDGRRSK